MKVYYNNCFEGLYPVGTAAIVVANSPEVAAMWLEIELAKIGLSQEILDEDMIELNTNELSVRILQDGDY